jgi:D-alanine-D-alanine ligase
MVKKHQRRVGVIFGGRSGEHEVSLMSARSVIAALDPEKYEVMQIGITRHGEWLVGVDVLESLVKNHIEQLMPVIFQADPTRRGMYRIRMTSPHGETLERLEALDVVFPVLHGTYGEDGTLQGLLELGDAAYVGAGVLGSSVGMDKALFRDVMVANQIPVVATVLVLRSELAGDMQNVLSRAEDKLGGYPMFVKPANLGSSVGISKCRNRSDLMEGLLEAARFDRRVLIEHAVDAREIEISILGNDRPQASVPGEVIPSREFYSYDSKYIDGTSRLLIPAPIPAKTAETARDLALRAYQAIDCSGMARVDFFLDKHSGELYLSELNTLPGFTQISMYPKLWEASGLPYPALLDRLIELAMERKADRDRTQRSYQTQSL